MNFKFDGRQDKDQDIKIKMHFCKNSGICIFTKVDSISKICTFIPYAL